MKDHLRHYGSDDDICISRASDAEQVRTRKGMMLNKHSTAIQIRSIIGPERFRSLFKFAFTRNPFTRTISTFQFLKYNFRDWANSSIMDKYETLEHFVTSDFFRRPGPGYIFEPQSRWLADLDGTSCVNFIGRTESLEVDMEFIRKSLRLPAPCAPLRRKNESIPHVQPPQAAPLSPRAICAIYARYAEDFTLLGYSPDPCEPLESNAQG